MSLIATPSVASSKDGLTASTCLRTAAGSPSTRNPRREWRHGTPYLKCVENDNDMATPSQMKELSVLALITSDAAYTPKDLFDQERTTSGLALLHSFPDSSNPADEQGVPTIS